MLKVNCFIMDMCKFIVIFLMYCVTAAYFYPSKPLNERTPSELTWQAWLLLDDQNQNKQQTNPDGTLRRRITPKSVFVVPTFDPCPEGYTPGVKKDCVRIIIVEEEQDDLHDRIIIDKVNQKFGHIDYDYEEETSTQGPLQINIPLDTKYEEEPTPIKAVNVNLDKRDSIDDEEKQEMFLKKLAATTTEEPDGSTVTESITSTSSEEVSTVTEYLTSATEMLTTNKDTTTPTESHYTKRSTDNIDQDTTISTIATTTVELPGSTTIVDTTTNESGEITTSAPKMSESQTFVPIKFPEDTKPLNPNNSVKFPDFDVISQTQIPPSVELYQMKGDVNGKDSFQLPDSARKVVFRERSQPEEANLDYSNGVKHLPPATTHHTFNRRNRDKHDGMYLLPPRWSQANFQRPLVFRFSRKYAYLDDDPYPGYFRSIPVSDYVSGKHRQSSRR